LYLALFLIVQQIGTGLALAAAALLYLPFSQRTLPLMGSVRQANSARLGLEQPTLDGLGSFTVFTRSDSRKAWP
jgi:hypothetical protein